MAHPCFLVYSGIQEGGKLREWTNNCLSLFDGVVGGYFRFFCPEGKEDLVFYFLKFIFEVFIT